MLPITAGDLLSGNTFKDGTMVLLTAEITGHFNMYVCMVALCSDYVCMYICMYVCMVIMTDLFVLN